MLNKYTEPSEWHYKAPFNNPGGQEDFTKDIQIHDNTFDGEFKVGICLGSRLSEIEEGENIVIKRNLFLDTKGLNPNYYPALFFSVKNIVFEGNTIGVLKGGTYNSPSDNVYFYCDNCSGELVAEKNAVTTKVEKGKRYVFSIAGSHFDRATIKDDSKQGFFLHYTPETKLSVKEATIITNCEPFPGTKYGGDVKQISNRN